MTYPGFHHVEEHVFVFVFISISKCISICISPAHLPCLANWMSLSLSPAEPPTSCLLPVTHSTTVPQYKYKYSTTAILQYNNTPTACFGQ